MEDLTWPEFKQASDNTDVALIPVGSVEQHGLHAPLKTDSLIAERIGRDVAEKMKLICCPTVKIGVSAHHKQFWGTLWVSPDTLKNYVREVAESFHYHGVEKVVFVNGHGGNRNTLKETAREIRSQSKGFAVAWTWFDSVEEEIKEIFGEEGLLHSDAPETSVLWALDEKAIRKNKLDKSRKSGSEEWGKIRGGCEITADVVEFSESGTVGNPESADPEKGKKVYQKAKKNLVTLVKWLREVETDELNESPHK
ncbi:hypothetical protein AKJ64_04705 [candidate division MSBL1 archaeon SCGC-AAA259E17]|uniref:Creatininase n=1 Tax=candidate division MSBL1 archaeon SCGC-AAA259E17 TaxID=1698263 RepID=A0A133UBC5_9EURY|nr:hypothetical protein AKJ64_04705 [candidate division MSBL1 archaeon SCGC-AAA259E17]